MRLNNALKVILVGTILTNCGGDNNPLKNDDDSDSDSGSEGVNTTSLDGLGLSSALSLEIPDSVLGEGGSSLALVAGKSREACEIRQTIKDSLDAVKSVGKMFCHFEVETDKIEFGKKINVEFSEGSGEDGSFQIWIDDSADDELTVYFCEDGTLQEKIVVDGAEDGRARGYVISHGSEGDNTWGRSAKFDNRYTDQDITKLLVKDSWSGTAGEAFRRLIMLDLDYSDSGINKVIMSSKGTWQGDTFESRGAALISPTYGMAIYNGKGTDPEGQTFEHVHKAFFNAGGLNVSPSATTDYSSGEPLHVTDALVPSYLTAESAPDPFAASDWDCTGTEVSVTLNPESAAHKACDSKDNFEREDCWSDAYQDGEDHSTFDDSAVADGDQVDL